jgi:hypothetical protein
MISSRSFESGALMAIFGRETERERERAAAWGQWMQQRHPLAIGSLVLGIFSLIELGAIPVFSLGGLVIGIAALRQLRRPRAAQLKGRRLAVAGIVISSLALLSGGALYLHSYLMR